jgi:hypothetical protein
MMMVLVMSQRPLRNLRPSLHLQSPPHRRNPLQVSQHHLLLSPLRRHLWQRNRLPRLSQRNLRSLLRRKMKSAPRV